LLDENGTIKISDFGFSAIHRDEANSRMLFTSCGSPNYVAPEVIDKGGYEGTAADVWSTGVILYVMLAGCIFK
jgi:5'-AMP-activated protein kinase catalytic alpha subunit